MIRLKYLAVLLLPIANVALADPNFKAPFACGQTWTYSTYAGHNVNALDWVRSDNGVTNGAPVLTSAAGVVTARLFDPSAGNMVVVDHGGGWTTRYYHLSSFSVNQGQNVAQGQEIGKTGSTGYSSGPHIHYEQLYNNIAQTVRINGYSLAPYPYSYFQKVVTSDNGCGVVNPPPPPPTGQYWVDTFAHANGRSTPGGTITGTLYQGTHYVYCKVWGPKVQVGSNYNHWWLKTDLDVGPANQWVSAYMLSRWGNDEARDNNGAVIPNCP
ncbi:MAG: M23 family metallopeptidase [Pseudomonadota bacterium]|nr:M23 family metallopeptidase [Pseudomonadota bacterium]